MRLFLLKVVRPAFYINKYVSCEFKFWKFSKLMLGSLIVSLLRAVNVLT